MAKYIQDKSGKMAGSIGDGKTNVPVSNFPKTSAAVLDSQAASDITELFGRFTDARDALPTMTQHVNASFICSSCGAANSYLAPATRFGTYSQVCQFCAQYQGVEVVDEENAASEQAVVQLNSFEDTIAEVDDKIAAIKALPEDAYVRVGDLRLSNTHVWNDDDVISRKDALDLARLEKAIAREARTEFLVASERAAGVERLHQYGDGLLGTAEATGTYEPNTREWLLARAQGIGGSDKIGYLNDANEFVPYDASHLRSMLSSKTPEAIAKIEATARTEPLPEGAIDDSPLPIQIGNRLERTIQYEFAVNNPQYVHLEDKSSRISVGRPYHRFNPDGVLQDKSTGQYGIFEAKTSRDAVTFEKALPGYKAQCLHNAAAANLPFAVLVADVEGEAEQRVVRLDFTEKELADYRRSLDRVWKYVKPDFERRRGQFR